MGPPERGRANGKAPGRVVTETVGHDAEVTFDVGGPGDRHFLPGIERKTSRNPMRVLLDDFLLPKGFPDSVTPQYAPYMMWRGVQYFFGGAIGVYTTKALIQSVGVSASRAAASSAALQWVVKDGAGRAGRFLFARWGKDLDGDLKQYRLLGDLLMEGGALLELSTAALPQAFLPLACAANLAKNLAAVAMSATRAPIYRSFAQNNNMADITARGESVANIADLAGTALGLALSRAGLPPTGVFAVLSAGYLVASRKEIDAVELPYYNQGRLALACREFLMTGVVPDPTSVNREEPLVMWADHGQNRVKLGSSMRDAFCSWGAMQDDVRRAIEEFRDKRYILSVSPAPEVHVMLTHEATADDVTEAAFLGHTVLHRLEREQGPGRAKRGLLHRLPKWMCVVRRVAPGCWRGSPGRVSQEEAAAALAWARSVHGELYRDFMVQSRAAGWKTGITRLNSRDVRLKLA